jgi:uncharacterized iron-regulated protein
MRAVMGESGLDTTVPAEALQQQRENIRTGHCGLLPESQIVPMTRIQLARDRAMALTARESLRPGQTVLLVAGHQHVRRDIGVPQHLPPGQPLRVVVAMAGAEASADAAADRIWRTAAIAPVDHCAELRRQWGPGLR